MPLWKIFHPPSTFTDPETKSSLSKTITKLYSSSGLPAFYVVVLFIPVAPENMYVGGVSRPSPNDDNSKPGPDSSKPFIRVTIEHVARKMPDHEAQKLFIWAVDRVLKPHIADKGYDWEYTVIETERELWKIQGLVPPLEGSEGEKYWAKVNQPLPYPGWEALNEGPKKGKL